MIAPAGRAADGRSEAVLIAAADEQLRNELSRLFVGAGFETTESGRGDEAVRIARQGHASLVVLDLELEDMSGYVACSELRDQVGDDLRILILSRDRTEPQDRVAGILIGADDYLSRPFAPDELVVRARRLLSRGSGPSPTTLTTRELQVLQLLADGLSTNRIAQKLFISPKTVATHIQRILTKLGVHSRTEAVAVAYRLALTRQAIPPSRGR
jgi:two-component system nitrate/nitrite response regulator NarL